MMLVESVQGALRRALFAAGDSLASRQAAVALSAVVIVLIAWATRRWWGVRTAAAAFAVGALWAGLTLAFEIALGRALGVSWSRLASDYDLLHGGLMPLGLLVMGLSPWVIQKVADGRRSGH